MTAQVIHSQLQVSLFHVARSSYRSLHLLDNTHNAWALSYLAEGSVTTESRNCRSHVEVGDIMLHPPGIAYSELATGPGTHEWLLLNATLPPRIDLFRLYPVSPVVSLAPRHEFSAAFQSLYSLWLVDETPFRELLMLAQATRLLTLVLQCWQQAGSVPRPLSLQTSQDRFTGVINYMLDHLDQRLSRDLLAAQVSLHPVYFDRLFRQTYALSPLQMLRSLRLERAKELLENSSLTVGYISRSCGFPSPTAFINMFQAKYLQTPGEYRQSLKTAIERYNPFL